MGTVVGLLAAVLSLSTAAPSRADQPDVRIMSEPTGYTNVLDAFQEGDPFDFAAHLSYRLRSESARIQRERSTMLGRAAADFFDVGTSEQTVKELIFGLDLGLFRDVMLSLRFPFVLSDERRLQWAASTPGSTVEQSQQMQLQAVLPRQGDFVSKPRDGLPGFDVGLSWGVTNQFRTPDWPTWVLVGELRLATGSVLRPCASGSDCEPGNSDGTSQLNLESRFSYRYRHVEPYLGMNYLHRYVAAPGESRFAATDSRPRAGEPPREVGLTAGVAIVPWEDRRRFQRFTVDLRGTATYVGSGMGPSPLFDALGTSPLVGDSITGMTELGAHGKLGLDAAIMLRAARYVRFRAALELDYNTPYLITGAPYCGGAVVVDAGVQGRSGTCGGEPFLPAIDLPGQRFRAIDQLSLAVMATALGQF